MCTRKHSPYAHVRKYILSGYECDDENDKNKRMKQKKKTDM